MTKLAVSPDDYPLTPRERRHLNKQLTRMRELGEVVAASLDETGRVHTHALRRVGRTLKMAQRRRNLRTTISVSPLQFQRLTEDYLNQMLAITALTDAASLGQILRLIDEADPALPPPDFLWLGDD